MPKLSANLLSVSKIVQNGNSVTFNPNGCFIHDSRNRLIAKCKEGNGMYKIKSDNAHLCMLVKKEASANDAFLWHRRLGHLNFNSMKTMRDGVVTYISKTMMI